MSNFIATAPLRFALLLAFLFCCTPASAQELYFKYLYTFEPTMVTEGPQLGALDVKYPEAAKKNGVEGTVKASLTLGEDGKVRDIVIVQDLPHGVGEAVKVGLQKLYFKPAAAMGKPAAIKASVDYVITVFYSEIDGNVSKPKIVEKPQPAYPEKHRAEKVKGKVAVTVMFFADGQLKVVGTGSTMPREFDKAAAEAAKLLKFTPAIHKKSKQPVSQQIIVEYDFKP
jgi:TonB family protein